jgi:hypothetical protein
VFGRPVAIDLADKRITQWGLFHVGKGAVHGVHECLNAIGKTPSCMRIPVKTVLHRPLEIHTWVYGRPAPRHGKCPIIADGHQNFEARRRKMRWTVSSLVTVPPACPLQQLCDRGEAADDEVKVNIKGLLNDLCANDNTARCATGRARTERVDDSLGDPSSVALRESRMQTPQVNTFGVCPWAKCLGEHLGICDCVAYDQRRAATFHSSEPPGHFGCPPLIPPSNVDPVDVQVDYW